MVAPHRREIALTIADDHVGLPFDQDSERMRVKRQQCEEAVERH